MADARPRRDPLDVKLSPEAFAEVEQRLADEIRTGLAARSIVMQDNGLIDYAYSLYEQRSQQGISRETGEPDLTSPIATEMVDTLSARATQNLFRLEPFWIVEGVGEESAHKAPVVESFVQVRQEDAGFRPVAKRAITASFVETGSVLEVCEDTERIVCHERVKAKIARSEIDGSVILDGATGLPTPALDTDGMPIPAEASDGDAYVEVVHTYEEDRRRGAYFRRRSMKDFMFLPNHAEDTREVWGHATRFWMTSDEIQRQVDAKAFRKDCLATLGLDTMERQQSQEAERAGVSVAYTPGTGHAEHELWRVQFWADLDGQGLTCYVAVVSERHTCILSLRYDWLKRWRTIYLNPYPCPYSVYGYSAVFTKLGTTIEEHTAWRNMNALRATLKSNAPIKRLRGSQWDPRIQPMGAGEVIDVDNMREIEPMDFEDVSVQALNKEGQCVTDSQRLMGVNDVAVGQLSAQKRTLGENEMATRQSFVRTDDPIDNLQEAFEEVGQVFYAIELKTLEARGEIPAPASVTTALQYGGDQSFGGTFTAEQIRGQFRFKPRGSSDAADPNQRKQQLNILMETMANWSKVNPILQARLASPEFAEAMMQMLVEEYKPRDRKAFLAPIQMPAPMLPPGMPMPGGAPGGPPIGGPPQFGGDQLVQQLTAQLPQGGAQ